jgi:hypothetical protein
LLSVNSKRRRNGQNTSAGFRNDVDRNENRRTRRIEQGRKENKISILPFEVNFSSSLDFIPIIQILAMSQSFAMWPT